MTRRVVRALLGCCFALSFLTSPQAWSSDDGAWIHVKTTLLSSEVYGPIAGIIRWSRPVSLQIIGASREDERHVVGLVREINRVIARSGVRITIKDDNRSDIAIMFTRQARFPTVARLLGVTYSGTGTGYNWLWPGPKSTPNKGFALVRSDQSKQEKRATAAQELFQILGLPNDSPVYLESVLYETKSEMSSATSLAPVDRKLLRFLYLHLEPGDDPDVVRMKFDRVWRSIPSD